MANLFWASATSYSSALVPSPWIQNHRLVTWPHSASPSPPALYSLAAPQLHLCLLLSEQVLPPERPFLIHVFPHLPWRPSSHGSSSRKASFLNPAPHTYCCPSTDSSIVLVSSSGLWTPWGQGLGLIHLGIPGTWHVESWLTHSFILSFNKLVGTQLKNGHGIWIEISSKNIHEWPITTWKDAQTSLIIREMWT